MGKMAWEELRRARPNLTQLTPEPSGEERKGVKKGSLSNNQAPGRMAEHRLLGTLGDSFVKIEKKGDRCSAGADCLGVIRPINGQKKKMVGGKPQYVQSAKIGKKKGG